jgi:hypothetical protein
MDEANAKAEHYRLLNQPSEAESICRDVLAADPEDQLALRNLGLAITDQFTGGDSDRYAEVADAFGRLTDDYESAYYTGILHERRVKAQLAAGRPPHALLVTLQEALRCFEAAESIRPERNGSGGCRRQPLVLRTDETFAVWSLRNLSLYLSFPNPLLSSRPEPRHG